MSQNRNVITYTHEAYFGDSGVSNPETQYSDRLIGHFSDGVNKSSSVQVRIIGFRSDFYPINNPDGIPDSWNNTYYNNDTGPGATADTDLDGYNTLQEYRQDSDPTNATSNISITGVAPGGIQWVGRRFDLYRIQTRTDLLSGDWTTFRLDTETEDIPTFTSEDLPEAANGGAIFYRVERVQ